MEIVKVEGIGRPRRKVKTLIGCGANPELLLYERKADVRRYSSPPSGTITFKSVKVLE